MSDYDVIIVGGGISGLLSALTLSRHGKSVLVLEKERIVGGNCNSYMVDGFQVDTGPHAITHLKEGPLRRLMDEYFTYMPVFVDYGHYYVRTEHGLTKIPSNLKEFATFDVLPRKDRFLLSQTLTKALTLKAFGMIEDKSVYDFLPKGLSKDALDFVDAIAPFLSGKSMKETSVNRVLYGSSFARDSVSENIFEEERQDDTSYASLITDRISKYQLMTILSSFSRLATNKVSYAQAYPRGGLKTLLNAVLFSMPGNVMIKTNESVKKILTSEEKASGVATETDSYFAENIIYSGFVKSLPSLISLPSDYTEKLSRIDQTLSLTIWLGLSEKMKEFDYTGSEVWFKGGAYWAMPISNYDPCIAPKGKQLVGFTFVINEDRNIEDEKKKAFDLIIRAVPGIENRIEMTHLQVTIPEKAAVTINGFFAGPRSPIPNLYLVGTDTDNRSMGVTRAGYSVLELLRAMKEDGKL
ncbi:MAG: NAD(P)/FAD-dependent oxidoreductase [Candidatus Methanoperedens sp.]|nr:NAD(P)/FAD-dependent oxidoreductase [Candidatus Methanoperedens sp.]MCE8428711.1 NAD(P)/FAD-dependent oxidoreductase [Candidatus Methanoperedens sp.]